MNLMRFVFLLCFILVLTMVSITLLGWFNNKVYLASIDKGYIPMAPLTAGCFILLSLGAGIRYFQNSRGQVIVLIFAFILLLLSDVFLSYFNIPFIGIEKILVSNPGFFDIVPVGRMSPITLFLFLFAATCLLLTGLEKKGWRQAAGIISSVALLATLILLVGYLYKTPLLYGQPVIPVALTTSLCFFLLFVMLLTCNGKEFFPLNLFFGNKTHVRLLRVFLPMTAFLILAGGALQIYLRTNFEINEALVISIIALASVILVAVITVISSQVISRQINKAETETSRLTAIISATNDFIGIFKTDGTPLYLNPAMRLLAGINNDIEMEGLHFRQFYPSEAASELEENALPLAIANGRWMGETIVAGKYKNLIPVLQVILYQKNKDDKEDWFAVIARDIGELKKVQDELEQFAYVASHDLKEPLRMVNSFVSLLKKNYGNQLDETAHSYIQFAVDGANRMTTLINDLLDYSRTGRLDVSPQLVNVDELLKDIVEINSKAIIAEKKAIVQWENMPSVYAGKTLLQQVFQNLISNGIKYQKPGVQPVIEISHTETDTHWQFSIKDNGIGIRPEYFEKVFMIFQRLHNKNEYSGSGIGLAICKKIVGQHKGKIWISSEPGKGSIFYFTISKQL